MKIILPFNVSTSKVENGKAVKAIIVAGEEFDIEEDELPYYQDLRIQRELATAEIENKREKDEDLRQTLAIRATTSRMRFNRTKDW